MRPLLQREKVILWVAALVAVCAAFYFFVYTPKMKDIKALEQQRQALTKQLDEMKAKVARKAELERRVQELQREVQESEAKLPSAREIPTLLVQLERNAVQAGTNLTLIKPGPLQQPPGAQATAPGVGGQPAPKPPAGARPSTPGQAPAPPPYQLFSLELSTEGYFDQVKTFLRGIETFPRFISMTDLRITPSPAKAGDNPGKPRLVVGVTAITYVLPEDGGSR
jgi:Tfp pilus assembly protein PilO